MTIHRMTYDPPIEIETGPNPGASIIWLHGLGADGHDFEAIVPELDLPDAQAIRFIFPHAPMRPITINGGYVMRGWYDIYSLEDLDREDMEGLEASREYLEQLMEGENRRGIPHSRIILMGFSQGGAVALHTARHLSQPLAGIGALSAYLPLRNDPIADNAIQHSPIFMAHGRFDPVVHFDLGKSSCEYLSRQGCEVEWHDYPMEHSLCAEEVEHLSNWIKGVLTSST
jgi:phospholipase/carboxylesterase